MRCSIITIGDEILIGQTVDTNSAWLGEKLNALGFEIVRIISIQDKADEIVKALDEIDETINLIIITGGLGPTNDDLTKYTLARYFNSELIMNKSILAGIEAYFYSRGLAMLDVNRQQAMLPEKADILVNSHGSAAGMWFLKNKTVVISLPGVPYEMKGIMKDFGFDKIKTHFHLPFIYQRTILIWGIGESFLANKMEDWEKRLRNDGLHLAYLPSPGIVKLRISKKGEPTKTKMLVDKYVNELYNRNDNHVFGEGKETMEQNIGKRLTQNNLTLSTAESCTGGYIAHLITSIPGSSAYFKGSIISYANEIKVKELGVSDVDIDKYGAVSEEVVKQMAIGVREKMNTDFAIATSGIAGPDGGSLEKPVGTIWVALSSGKGTKTKLLRLGKHRTNNIRITSIWALGMLLKQLKSKGQ